MNDTDNALPELAKHQIEGIDLFYKRAQQAATLIDTAFKQPPAKLNKGWTDALLRSWADNGTGRLFAWAMGAGKTRAGLTILAGWRSWYESFPHTEAMTTLCRRPHLVVAKASGIHVWGNELRKWFPNAPTDWIINPTTSKQVRDAVQAILERKARVLAISYSLLARNVEEVEKLTFALGLFDEVQQLTNTQTQRAQAVYRIMRLRTEQLPGMPFEVGVPGILFKGALSGTPFTNRPTDLWPVLAMLQGVAAPRNEAGKTVYVLRSPEWKARSEFERQYTRLIAGAAGGVRVPCNLVHDPKNDIGCAFHHGDEKCNHLHPRLRRTVMHRVTADEAWPNLPQAEPEWIEVEMGATQKRIYKNMVDEEILPTITSRGHGNDMRLERMALMTYAFECCASTRQLELSAIRKGRLGVQLREKEKHESAILDEVVTMAADMEQDEPLLVFTLFQGFAEEIATHPAFASRKPLLLSGGTNLKNADAERIFQSGKSNMIVATTKGIEAMTLTRARTVIIAGFLSFSPFDIMQAIYRIRRPGQQAERLMVYCLYTKGTLLEWLQSKLAKKLDAGFKTLDGRTDGADDLGVGAMTDRAFEDAFWGK